MYQQPKNIKELVAISDHKFVFQRYISTHYFKLYRDRFISTLYNGVVYPEMPEIYFFLTTRYFYN